MACLTCREIILDHLPDYLDGTLNPEKAADFERHLADCPACVAYLNTYKRTRELVGGESSTRMTEKAMDFLRQFLQERLVEPGPLS